MKSADELLLTDLLEEMHALNASDLFITAGDTVYFRVDGNLVTRKKFPKLFGKHTRNLAYSMLKEAQKKKFEEELELDLSFSYRGVGRFRANLFLQRGCVSVAIRLLPSKIIPLEYLGLPPKVEQFIEKAHGLVLVTGSTGSGKTTTLAAFIDRVNEKYPKHIITIEDPIEYVFQNKKSAIEQREVGADTKSFANALKYVLRQNPDVVIIGEMRDQITMEAALNIADTGHLTFGTLHTANALQTITRIIDSFPADKQDQIRTQLSFVLEGVICQTLIPQQYSRGRALSAEVMVVTPGIRNLIRTRKLEQVYTEMQVSSQRGSQTMNQSLTELYKRGIISYNKAKSHADPDKLTELTQMLDNVAVSRRPGAKSAPGQGKMKQTMMGRETRVGLKGDIPVNLPPTSSPGTTPPTSAPSSSKDGKQDSGGEVYKKLRPTVSYPTRPGSSTKKSDKKKTPSEKGSIVEDYLPKSALPKKSNDESNKK